MTTTLALVGLLAAAPAIPGTQFAIVVGTNTAPDDVRRDLRFADDDAARYHQLFAQSGIESHLLTSFDGESQQVFPDLVDAAVRPTHGNFLRVVAEVRARMSEARDRGLRTTLYFFYAGHGQLSDGEGSVTLLDSKLSGREFRELVLDDSPATLTHVIIDACKSYFFVAGRGLRRERYSGDFAGPARRDDVGYILSTSNDADSHEWAVFGGGVASHEVRSALVGAADADGSGSVDYGELAAFVGVANEAVPIARYRPQIFIQPPKGNRAAPVFAPSRLPSSAQLRIEGPEAGRIVVHDARGVRYADVHKGANHSVRLVLGPPFPYRVRFNDRTFLVRGGGATSLSEMPSVPTSTAVAARGDIHAAFDQLFATPFDAEVVRGFKLAEDRVAAMIATQAPAPRDPVPYVLLGSGAVATALGVLFTALAADARVDARTGPQVDRPGAMDRATAFEWTAGATFALGAATIASGVVMLVMED